MLLQKVRLASSSGAGGSSREAATLQDARCRATFPCSSYWRSRQSKLTSLNSSLASTWTSYKRHATLRLFLVSLFPPSIRLESISAPLQPQKWRNQLRSPGSRRPTQWLQSARRASQLSLATIILSMSRQSSRSSADTPS